MKTLMNKYFTKMKTNRLLRLLVATFFFYWIFGISALMAQNDNKNVSTNISYKVDFGPVYPIEGESYQIVGKVALDDVTGEPKTIGFKVPLNSFIGQNSGYLAWVGNSWDNPDLIFSSTEIIQKDDTHYMVKGRLEFRRRPSPVQIDFTKRNTDSEI